MVNEVKDIIFTGKADLDLRRVNVDVHKIRRHFQKQDSSRKFSLHHGALIGHFHTRHHGAVTDIAAIDVKILHTPAGPAALGLSDEASNPVDALLVIHFHKVTAEFPAQNRVSGTAQLPIAGGDVLQFALTDKFEADFRVAQGYMRHDIGHKGTLAGIFFQELHPGWRVIKQVPYPDGGTHTAGTRLHGLLFPALNMVDGSALRIRRPGQHLHTGHTGNGSQRLAAKAQRMDVGQVIFGPDFTGCVPDESRGDIFRFNAGAIIADLNEANAARFDRDGHLRGTGINGVFQ